jgi:hypothetical protein
MIPELITYKQYRFHSFRRAFLSCGGTGAPFTQLYYWFTPGFLDFYAEPYFGG